MRDDAESMRLDRVDHAILNVLQNDARVSNVDLAERVNLSPSACLRRVKRLESVGVIDRYVTLVDPTLIGRPTSVFVEISLSGQHEDLLDAFEAKVGECPEVMSCHLMAGNADYLVHVVCADVADYERIHRSHLAQLPNVARLRTSFALRTVTGKTEHQLP